jgi:hypothetical protein
VSASGYHFVNWSGDLSGSTNPATIVVDCDKKITANFSQKMYSLTIQVDGSGSVTPTVGTHSYGEGTVISITVIPDSGWLFDSWIGDVHDPDSATTTVTVDSNMTLTARLAQVMPSWWLVGIIIVSVLIIGMTIGWVVRSRMI